jgi:hypothetical protein
MTLIELKTDLAKKQRKAALVRTEYNVRLAKKAELKVQAAERCMFNTEGK